MLFLYWNIWCDL